MPRRRRKKQRKYSCDESNGDNEPVIMMDIEEELRQQRIRQQERKESKDAQKTRFQQKRGRSGSISSNGGCSEGNAMEESNYYKPTGKSPESMFDTLLSCQSVSGFHPALFAATSGLPRRCAPQVRIHRDTWIGSAVFERMRVREKASTLYSAKKWRDTQLPNGTHCSWDLSCKSYCLPSARTFDVAESKNGNTRALPLICTIVQGGLLTLQSSRRTVLGEGRCSSIRGEPAHAVRIGGADGATCIGAITRVSHRHHSPYKFFCYDPADGCTMHSEDLYEPVHDLCFGSEDLVMFAPGKSSKWGADLNPLFLSLESSNGGQVRSLQVDGFPSSDALRIEMACRPKVFAFGHRNGQVSVLDLRASTNCCAKTVTEVSLDSMGSATDILFPEDSGRSLLVKRSFGCCQLHDMRRIGGGDLTPSLVSTLSPPPGQFHTTLSSHCNGVALDPISRSIVISPYMNEAREVSLGAWSIQSGMFLGTKPLHGTSVGQPYAELCQVSTPNEGLWFKHAHFSDSAVHSKAGSLHSISFCG